MVRWRTGTWAQLALVVLIAVASSAVAIAVNAASSVTAPWPFGLDTVRTHPFAWAGGLTALTAIGTGLLWWLQTGRTAGPGGPGRHFALIRQELTAAGRVLNSVGDGLSKARHRLGVHVEGSSQPHWPEADRALQRAIGASSTCREQLDEAIKLVERAPDGPATEELRHATMRRRIELELRAEKVARRVTVTRVRSEYVTVEGSVENLSRHLVLLARSLDTYEGALNMVGESLGSTRDELLDPPLAAAGDDIRRALGEALSTLDGCRSDVSSALRQVDAYLRQLGVDPWNLGDWRDNE